MRFAALLGCVFAASAQTSTPIFRAEANLESIAVRVLDRQRRDIRGLTAGDFTVLEDGHPQKIAFLAAEDQPISLAVLLDSSTSMESSRKLAGARAILKPLLRGNLPGDEISLAPFTDRVGQFQQLTAEQRANPPVTRLASLGGGTALYDAVSTSLCHLRTAGNVRQAVVVITDGADQHSRLALEQLIRLAQASKPQIFMIGFFDKAEHEAYKSSGKTVTLVSGHEIDNPIQVFDRVAKETGAESFFPSTEHDLQQVIDHILGILQSQYTLAYYPQDIGRFRRIQVKINRGGATVLSRRSAGSEGAEEPVHFLATSCEVSAVDHPYPWEPHVTDGPNRTKIYQDDFADPRSGWPNHPGSRYAAGAYEMSKVVTTPKFGVIVTGTGYEGILAAYGPWWTDFRASISIARASPAARGLVFRLNDEGYYVILLMNSGKGGEVSYKVVKRTFWNQRELELVQWTPITMGPPAALKTTDRLTVDCRRDHFTFLINDVQFATVQDDSYPDGMVGMAEFGYGHAIFHDLRVEGKL
ncbi:MAG TPA: VWA domain-containing protein [Bryobacteraceae bacterium]|nr:VWA domain-containing protein [Bryobacteraceae bacterium]